MSRNNKKAGKTKRVKLSPEEAARRRADRRFKADIRTVFINAGFDQIPSRDVNFTVQGITG
jgi:hypothetical protein